MRQCQTQEQSTCCVFEVYFAKIDNLTIEFQSEFRLQQFHRSISDEYCIILGFFIKESAMASIELHDIKPLQPSPLQGRYCCRWGL